jgi:GH24 family phage-related lysozyme (muramidase)
MEYLDESAAKVEDFENRIHWMYLDKPGNVTVGIGKELPSLSFAQALPFRYQDGMPATAEEIAIDFARVSGMEPGHTAIYYLSEHSCRLQDPDIEALLFSELADCDRWLAKHFPNYPNWRKPAKLGALDMRYNLGATRFLRYPDMIRGLLAGDWETVARECDRNIHDAAFAQRNSWTRCCFLDAGKEIATLAVA